MPREHPSGYQVADDSPGFVAPPLDLRRAVEAADRGAVEDAVTYALAFPIQGRLVEHTLGFEDEHENTNPEVAIHPVGDEPDTATDLPVVDPTGTSPAIAYVDADSTTTMERIPDPERTIERDPYASEGEITVQASERQVLQQSLASIGPLDETPDPRGLLPAASRVLLARARAIRFRLALLDVWPEDWSSPRGTEELLDLAVHPTAIVTIADGFPSEPPQLVGTDDIAVVSAIAHEVRERLPSVTRATLRDVGAAAFARVTLLGTERATEYLRQRFADLPGAERRAALATAAKVATPGRRAEMLDRLRAALGV